MEDLPEAGQPDVRRIVVEFTPRDESEPVTVGSLDTECCYGQGEHTYIKFYVWSSLKTKIILIRMIGRQRA